MERSEAEAIYDAGRDVCVEFILRLEERVSALERRLNQDSSNSSKPPSSDPYWKQPKRGERGSGGKRGAQDGHEGHHRNLFSGDRVDVVVEAWPQSCRRCGVALDQLVHGDSVVHQVAELPPVAVQVTEYRLQRVCCSGCDAVTIADLPDGVTRSAFGPRLHALAATLTTQLSGSRRKVADIITTVFGCPISTGAVDAMLERVGDALKHPYGALVEAMRGADCVNADETSWRLNNQWQWLWGAFTAQIAVLMIDPSRTSDAAQRLLGDHQGVVSSDRHGAYNQFTHRQLCWAHLDRNLTALAQTSESAQRVATRLKASADETFAAWARYRDKHQDRAQLRSEIATIRDRMWQTIDTIASQPKRARNRQLRRFCRSLAKSFEQYWTFVEVPGVQPTNNHAERGLRHAVIYRKISGGSKTERGAITTQRLLSIHQTCRLQQRSLFEYLADVMQHTARGQPAPTPLPP